MKVCMRERERESGWEKKCVSKKARVCMRVCERVAFFLNFYHVYSYNLWQEKKTAKRWSWILNNVRFLKWRQIVGSRSSKRISFKINFSKKYGERKSFFSATRSRWKFTFFWIIRPLLFLLNWREKSCVKDLRKINLTGDIMSKFDAFMRQQSVKGNWILIIKI